METEISFLRNGGSCANTPSPRHYVVVMDAGTSASVKMLRFEDRARVGDRFRHAGMLWEIASFRCHGKVLMAGPVPQ